MITDKIIILDAFGTIVQITTRLNPYRLIIRSGNENPMVRHVHPNTIIKENFITSRDAHLFSRQLLVELSSIKEVDGARKFLTRLKNNNNYLVVASNLATPYCDTLREIYGDLIDLFWLSCEIGDKKPNESFYLGLLSYLSNTIGLDIDLKNVYMIGDSYTNDYSIPIKLGITAIHEVGTDRLVDWARIEQKVSEI